MNDQSPHTEIIVDTDKYSGNFEREITAWVFGVYVEWSSAAEEEYLVADPALAWARENPDTYEEGALTTFLHEEYGSCWQEIVPTPGWQNDHGAHTRLAEGQESVTGGAYQSVRWIFSRVLSDEEIENVKTRVRSFADEWTERMQGSNREDAVLRIEGVRVFEVIETRTEIQRF